MITYDQAQRAVESMTDVFDEQGDAGTITSVRGSKAFWVAIWVPSPCGNPRVKFAYQLSIVKDV